MPVCHSAFRCEFHDVHRTKNHGLPFPGRNERIQLNEILIDETLVRRVMKIETLFNKMLVKVSIVYDYL